MPGEPELTVAVVADALDEATQAIPAGGEHVHYDAKEGLLWAQAHWRAPSPLRS